MKQLMERFLSLASKAPPRGGTRPTTPCRPGPLTRPSLERPTPDPSQEGGKYSSAPRKFPSWEGLGVGSWRQCMRKKGASPRLFRQQALLRPL